MLVVPHDLAVLAGARLGFVGVDHEILRTSIRLLRHERPFQAGRESGTSAPAQRCTLHFFDDGGAAFFKKGLRSIPGPARTRALEAPVVLAIQISEDTVLVSTHGSPLLLV